MFFLASWIVVVFCWSKRTVLSLLIVLLLVVVLVCLVVCLFVCCLFVVCLLFPCYAVCLFASTPGPSKTKKPSISPFNAEPQGRGAFKDHRLGQKQPEESIRKTHAVQVPWGFRKIHPVEEFDPRVILRNKKGTSFGWVGGSNGCFFLQRIDVYIYISTFI